MKDLYEDIINRPHHVSKARPQMSELERAAQFAPVCRSCAGARHGCIPPARAGYVLFLSFSPPTQLIANNQNLTKSQKICTEIHLGHTILLVHL